MNTKPNRKYRSGKLPENKTDYWLSLVSLPFRAYIIFAPVILVSFSCDLPGDESRIFDLSVAGIGWADIGCLFVLSGMAWVAFWINARKMFKILLIYLVIGLVLASLLIPLDN